MHLAILAVGNEPAKNDVALRGVNETRQPAPPRAAQFSVANPSRLEARVMSQDVV
jgi:hypothetical protein